MCVFQCARKAWCRRLEEGSRNRQARGQERRRRSAMGGGIKEVAAEARREFEKGVTVTMAWRVGQLQALLRLLEEREVELCEAVAQDLGKSSHEVLISEILYLRNSCKDAKKNLKKWAAPQKVPVPLAAFPTSAAVVAEPLGVILVISPWNFPLILALDPIIGAIAAGNAVVVKPSEIAPSTSAVLANLLPNYLDPKAVRIVEGGISESTLLLEQKWDKIFFTGCSAVARVVMAAATKHLTPVILELGGKCPVLVDSTADLDVTARRLVYGKWNCNYGQACIAPDYILVEVSVASKLVANLKKTLVEFYGEDAKFSKDHGRVVNHRHLVRLRNLLDEDSVSDSVVYGGEVDESTLYIAPTILLNPSLDSTLMKEEIFGPILPIIEVKCIDDAMDFVKSRPKPLVLYMFTKNKKLQQKALSTMQAGSIVFNETILQFILEGLPFGGVGESGSGSYHGKYSFDAFSHPKAVVNRSFLLDIRVRYPPFTEFKKRVVKQLLQHNNIGAVLATLGLKRDHKSDKLRLEKKK